MTTGRDVRTAGPGHYKAQRDEARTQRDEAWVRIDRLMVELAHAHGRSVNAERAAHNLPPERMPS